MPLPAHLYSKMDQMSLMMSWTMNLLGFNEKIPSSILAKSRMSSVELSKRFDETEEMYVCLSIIATIDSIEVKHLQFLLSPMKLLIFPDPNLIISFAFMKALMGVLNSCEMLENMMCIHLFVALAFSSL
jgi:uncharacterized membrane protein YukC